MKNKGIACFLAMTILVSFARGQGTFQNLNFEEARNLPVPGAGQDVPTTNALPGWTAHYGTNQLSTIPYDFPSIYPKVGLWDSNSSAFIIEGVFSVALGGGSISQSGFVPTNAMSLMFSAYFIGSVHALDVSLDGQSFPFFPLSSTPNYTVYGAEIGAFGGQAASLRFAGTGYMLDNIAFSSEPIPEPSAAALAVLCCGGLLLARCLLRIGDSSERVTASQ